MLRKATLAIAIALALAPSLALAQPQDERRGTQGAQTRQTAPEAVADAERRLQEYVRVWEDDSLVGPRAMHAYYADRVVYYGKRMSREEVLADKRRFIRAYPQRAYAIAPGSLVTRCEGAQCVARATLLWRRVSARGRESAGASRLTLVFSQRAQGRIVRESAVDLRR
jgi:hypothetical protein